MQNLRPLHNNVVLEPLEAEEKTTGGIIIPDTAKKKTIQGKVVAVGPGKKDDNGKLIPSDLQAGDIVVYEKWGGTEITINDKTLLVMKETDIIGIVEK
ncbi:MAG: co-chaperone GroES [Rickettsiaceae bacterium]|nr:co-chaperone GroES [Rickettsiaceae bacterium]